MVENEARAKKGGIVGSEMKLLVLGYINSASRRIKLTFFLKLLL